MPSASRESPFDCVARCASSRSFRRNARRLPPMTMLASPEERRAIMDSRGKCRSRWLGHHMEMRGRSADTSRPVQVGTRLVHGRPTARTRTFAARPRSRTWTAHGQLADADAVTDWTRTRPVADWTRPRIGHGLPVATDIGAAIWPDRLRIHRDCFADAKTSFSRGVRRVSSKTGRLHPCGCKSIGDQVRTVLPASRRRLDRLRGHFPSGNVSSSAFEILRA